MFLWIVSQNHTLFWPKSYFNTLKHFLFFLFVQAEDKISITTTKVTSEKGKETQSITVPQA